MRKLKILDLCSGIGGFSLGLESTGGFETIAFCEFDPFCQKVLNKHWPEVPIYNDLKEISKNEETIRNIPEHDLICGGIPCQPFSVAGKQKGKEDDRHLWPYMFKIIEQKKPTWVIVENVGGFVNVALDDVCLDLEAEGYSTQSFIIPACGVEAPHRRDRIWIIGKRDVADSNDTRDRASRGEVDKNREEAIERREEQSQFELSGSSEDVADSSHKGIRTRKRGSVSKSLRENDARSDNERRNGEYVDSQVRESSLLREDEKDVADSDSERLQGQRAKGDGIEKKSVATEGSESKFKPMEEGWWQSEPRVGRVANGIPNRVDRLKSLGNAIVPQIIYHIGLAILKEEE